PKEAWRAEANYDVPGRSNREENRSAGSEAKLPPAAPASRQRDESRESPRRKQHADGPARQRRQRAHCGCAPISQVRVEAAGPGAREQVEDCCKLEPINRLGNHVPCEDEHPNARGSREGRVKPGAVAEKSSAELEDQQDEP